MVNFYNKDRKIVMILHDFSFSDESEESIRFSADISYAFFKASRNIVDYKSYFDKFLSELKMLYDAKIPTAQFVPLERQLEIYFKQTENGHISVSLKLNHFNIDYVMHQSTLMIQYEIDQSFLSELINEIEKIVKKS